MQKRTIMSGKTTYYESENGVHYAQFDADCELPMLSRLEFCATVRRLENGTLQLQPKQTSRKSRSRAITLFRTRHICVSLGIDRRVRIMLSAPESDIRNLPLYIMEEVPQVVNYIYEFNEKMKK